MNTPTTVTLSNRALERIERDVETRFANFDARFVSSADAVRTIPQGLLKPLTRNAYGRLSVDERGAHLRAVLREQLTAKAIEHRASAETHRDSQARSHGDARSSSAPTPSTSPSTPAVEISPSAPALAPRYLVSCAGGCGAMLPAPSTRPVLRFCDGPHTPNTPRRRSPEELARDSKRAKKSRPRATCTGLRPAADTLA